MKIMTHNKKTNRRGILPYRLLVIVFVLFCASCCNNPTVQYSDKQKTFLVTINPPTAGMTRIGRTDWDNESINAAGKYIYRKLSKQSAQGEYSLFLRYRSKNRYGECIFSDMVQIGKLNANEVRRYVDYQYFKPVFERMIYQADMNKVVDTRQTNTEGQKYRCLLKKKDNT